jgi:hypothetical protein
VPLRVIAYLLPKYAFLFLRGVADIETNGAGLKVLDTFLEFIIVTFAPVGEIGGIIFL